MGNAENRKPLTYAGFANLRNPQKQPTVHS